MIPLHEPHKVGSRNPLNNDPPQKQIPINPIKTDPPPKNRKLPNNASVHQRYVPTKIFPFPNNPLQNQTLPRHILLNNCQPSFGF